MGFRHILYEKRGHIGVITLNRPEVLNALQPVTCQELAEVLLDYLEDEELRVAILAGAGDRAFCVGADLKHRADAGDVSSGGISAREMRIAFTRCCKPILAAVQGYCVGGGLELAMRCDIILASETARFGLPEVKRGLVADTGGTFFLPRRIPYYQAMRMILTGDLISASDALRMGLVTAVVPNAELWSTAESWARKFLECSPLAVQAAKEIVRMSLQTSVEPELAAIDRLASVQRLRASEDYLEGPRAFAEKRAPKWTGK